MIYAQSQNSSAFKEAEISLNNALDASASVYFPSDFEESVDHFKTAQKYSASRRRESDVDEELESSIKILTKINEKVEAINTFFKNVVDERNKALNKNSDVYAESIWNEAEEQFTSAISDYNNNNVNEASEAIPKLIELYQKSGMYADKTDGLLRNWSPITDADNSTAYLISPESYSDGMNYYKSALEKIASGEEFENINDDIKESQKYFDNAAVTAKKFEEKYPECLKARDDAKTANAENYAVEEWTKDEEILRQAGIEFEDENYDDVYEYVQSSFQQYVIAKRTAIKNQLLFVSRNKIQQAENSEADESVPKTFKKSLDFLKQAENLIDSDSFTEDEIKLLTDSCDTSADLAIEISQLQHQISSGDRTFEDVVLSLINQRQKQKLEKRSESPKPVTAKITEPVKNANQFDADISDIFSSDEIEILKEDNKTILRLFNLNFGWVNSNLTDDSKTTLDKLIPILEKYNSPSILIAAYTDNVAASGFNNTISERRAQNVMDYLSKHSTKLQNVLSSAGYGENNPIADNNTYEGRKKNNRIEIEIDK